MTSEFTSFQGGRYQVLRKLGEGGKGIVFLCQDSLLTRQVAIKLVKEEGLDAEGLLRFQREVQAMASLVHPNVVTVFDIGQQEVGAGLKPAPTTRPYLVLELMEGGDVEHLIAVSPNKRLDAATAVRIGKEVAKALEHAHRHNILHRDVKPGNIWLTRDPSSFLKEGSGQGVAKLGDFGLAYLGGSPRLTQAGMMVGSLAYMAPEVALGRQADARSDLYMLGASLYEMLTGRVPFPGDDPVRVLFSHINDLPLPPRRFAPEIPEGLESLILRLLSKDPEQRPASASEVLRTLEQVEIPPTPLYQRGARGDSVGAPLAAPRPATPEPRFAQALVGRGQELALLRQRVDAALRGEGSLVFLTGEAGIGKTRLAWEARSYARGRGFLWLEGRYSREGSMPFQPWVEAIRAFLRTAPPAFSVKVLLPYGAELAGLVPELAGQLGRAPSPTMTVPEAERIRLFEALAGFFTGIAREQPLALFLDDLQWATSMDTLHHLARTVATERLLMLGAYRDVELKERPPLARAVLEMNRERLFHTLPLKRLGGSEVAKMVGQTLGQAASPRLVEAVYQKTEGNPFFVEEVVRYLTESGGITLGEKGWEVQDLTLVQIPDSVKAVVGERLDRLGEEARSVLTWASVAGEEFTLPLLKEVTGVEEERLLEVVDKAVEARVLTPRPSLGQEVYAFGDEVISEVLYAGIGPARRRRYHLKVGQAVEKVHPLHLEEHSDALARHFLEGNDLPKALEYSLKAGERAYGLYTWERASGHFETALELIGELPEDLPRQAQVLERLADLDRLLGRLGLRSIQGALEIYNRLGDKRKAARMLTQVAGAWGSGTAGTVDYEKALAQWEVAVKLLEAEPDSLEKAFSSSWFALGLSVVLDLERALQYGRQALGIAEHLDDPDQVSFAYADLAVALTLRGELAQAHEYADRSWEAALQGKNPWTKAWAADYGILALPWTNDRVWLEQWLERSLEYRRSSQVDRYDIALYGCSALVLAWRGRPQEAAEALRRVEETISRRPHLFPHWVHFAGAAHAVLGDWDQARLLLTTAFERSEQAHATLDTVTASIYYAGLLLTSGNTARAEEVLIKGYALAHDKGSVLQELNLLPLLCELHVKTGRLEQAEQYLTQAQEILAHPQPWRGLAAPVFLAEGILATARGNWPEAEQAFGKALEAERAYGFLYHEARVLFEWGEMHLKRGDQGAASSAPTAAPWHTKGQDREKGMELLDQALAIFQGCAAKKDVEKVLARKEVLKA